MYRTIHTSCYEQLLHERHIIILMYKNYYSNKKNIFMKYLHILTKHFYNSWDYSFRQKHRSASCNMLPHKPGFNIVCSSWKLSISSRNQRYLYLIREMSQHLSCLLSYPPINNQRIVLFPKNGRKKQGRCNFRSRTTSFTCLL